MKNMTVLVFASLVLLSMPGALVAQTPTKVTVAYSAVSPIFAAVWMAKEMGAFEKQGLKADLVYISSGALRSRRW
jgi:ABC-type nitrate/sulfonate/bicarbonate transport system substrate-binding protein